MAFVYKRILAHATHNNVGLLVPLQRKEVGKLIAEAYHKANILVPLKRIRIHEPEGAFLVLKYPTEFIPQMDAIISNYYQTENVPCETKRIRKRIPAKPRKVLYPTKIIQ